MTPRPLPPGDLDALAAVIAEHAFCSELDADHLLAMAEAAMVIRLPAGAFVFQRGGAATALHLVTEGSVALEITGPGRPPLTIETLHPGDALGWSWLFTGRDWQFDARCVTDVTTVAIDAAHLRQLIDDDPVFGRDLVLRIGRVVVDRLVQTRAQLVDVSHHDQP